MNSNKIILIIGLMLCVSLMLPVPVLGQEDSTQDDSDADISEGSETPSDEHQEEENPDEDSSDQGSEEEDSEEAQEEDLPTPDHTFPNDVVVVDENWDGNTYTATIDNRGSSIESVIVMDSGIKFDSNDPAEREEHVLTPDESIDITFKTHREPMVSIDSGNINQEESLYRTWGEVSTDTRIGEALDNPLYAVIGATIAAILYLIWYHRENSQTGNGPLNAIR